MDYPTAFPKRLRPLLDAEILRLRHKYPLPEDSMKRIGETIAVFAKIACKAVEDGEWKVELAHMGFTEFAQELCKDHLNRRQSFWSGDSWHSYLTSMMERITTSKAWLGYLKKLARLAERSSVKLQNTDIGNRPVPETRKGFVETILREKGWSIEDWASEAGVSYHTASDYINGKRTPQKYNRVKLAKALGVDIKSFP